MLSLCAGFVLLGLWRVWPAFAQAARHPQGFASLLGAATRSGSLDLGRGLEITGLVFGVLALGLGLAWPGLLPAPARHALLWAYPLLCLLAHAEIHRRADRVAQALQPAQAPSGQAEAEADAAKQTYGEPPHTSPPPQGAGLDPLATRTLPDIA